MLRVCQNSARAAQLFEKTLSIAVRTITGTGLHIQLCREPVIKACVLLFTKLQDQFSEFRYFLFVKLCSPHWYHSVKAFCCSLH